MRFRWLLVKMESIYRPIIFARIPLLFGQDFRVQDNKLVHTRNIEVVIQLLVDFAGVSFINANIVHRFVIEASLLLDKREQIGNNSILRNKKLEYLLYQG